MEFIIVISATVRMIALRNYSQLTFPSLQPDFEIFTNRAMLYFSSKNNADCSDFKAKQKNLVTRLQHSI